MPDFKPTERLSRSGGAPLGYLIHEALHARLGELAEIAWEEGARRPSKRELLSALILDAPADAGKLDKMISRYHKATVADAQTHEPDDGNVIRLRDRKPGRPPG